MALNDVVIGPITALAAASPRPKVSNEKRRRKGGGPLRAHYWYYYHTKVNVTQLKVISQTSVAVCCKRSVGDDTRPGVGVPSRRTPRVCVEVSGLTWALIGLPQPQRPIRLIQVRRLKPALLHTHCHNKPTRLIVYYI